MGIRVGVGGGLGRGRQSGKNWDNCNNINNKTFKLKSSTKGQLQNVCSYLMFYSILKYPEVKNREICTRGDTGKMLACELLSNGDHFLFISISGI